MMTERLELSFTAEDDRACIEGLMRSKIAGQWPPDQISGDSKPWSGERSPEALLGCQRTFRLEWEPNSRNASFISWSRVFDFDGATDRTIVKTANRQRTSDVNFIRTAFEELPFLFCSGASTSSEWGFVGSQFNYLGCGFGDMHHPTGWMCSFKKNGHNRLVSRRWLDFGPWRVIRNKNDLTIVQFHELETDDRTALEQARPGHQLLTRGFLESDPEWEHLFEPPQSKGANATIKGLYDSSTRTLMQIVTGRDVSQEEMREACAIRLWKPLAEPVERVAYKFIREEDARRHLHELWLREIEVYAFIDGVERRIDLDYSPPKPIAPDWVKRVQDREGC